MKTFLNFSKVFPKNIQANKKFGPFSTCNKNDCQRKAKLSYKSFTAMFQDFPVSNNRITMQQGMTQKADVLEFLVDLDICKSWHPR